MQQEIGQIMCNVVTRATAAAKAAEAATQQLQDLVTTHVQAVEQEHARRVMDLEHEHARLVAELQLELGAARKERTA